jgi:hypothetical protein
MIHFLQTVRDLEPFPGEGSVVLANLPLGSPSLALWLTVEQANRAGQLLLRPSWATVSAPGSEAHWYRREGDGARVGFTVERLSAILDLAIPAGARACRVEITASALCDLGVRWTGVSP